jgi:AcrR family transcriptional regulator
VSHPSRENLIREATSLFAARGVDAVTIREVAVASGLHLPSIYHFFENKRALYRACVSNAMEPAASALARLLDTPSDAAPHDGAEARFDAFAKELRGRFEQDPVLLAFVCQEHLRTSHWLAQSSLQDPLARLVALIEGSTDISHGEAVARVTQLLGCAIGNALARQTLMQVNPKRP